MPLEASEVLSTIFEVIEGEGGLVGEAVEITTDSGITIAEGTATAVEATNGAAAEVVSISEAGGAASGAGLLALDVGVAGAAIAPALGILAGVGLYNLAPEFWTNVSNALVEAGQTIGGKVMGIVTSDGKFGLSEETIEIFKNAFIEAGVFGGGNYDIDTPIPSEGIYIKDVNHLSIQNLPSVCTSLFAKFNANSVTSDISNQAKVVATNKLSEWITRIMSEVPSDAIGFNVSFGWLFYQSSEYDFYFDLAFYGEDSKLTPGTDSIGSTVLDNEHYNCYLWIRLDGSIDRDVFQQVGGGLDFNGINWDMTNGEYIGRGLTNQNPVAFNLGIGEFLPDINTQDGAILPDKVTPFPQTYPDWQPIELPQTMPQTFPAFYPLEYPFNDPDQGHAQDPSPDPLPDPQLEFLLNTLPIPDPIPDLHIQPQVQPDPDPLPEPEPAPQTEPVPKQTDPIEPNPTPQPNPLPVVFPTLDTVKSTKLFTVYAPTQAQLDALGGFLWSSNILDEIKKIWQNPLDGIISLAKVYVSPVTGSSHNIILGNLDSEVSSLVVTSQFVDVNCGSVTIPEEKRNATDYSPYSTVHIYLPFIGIHELDVDEIMGGSIRVLYHVDVYTGTCLADILLTRTPDVTTEKVIYTFSGNCSQSLPLTSSSAAGMIHAILGLGAGAISVAGGGALGAVAAASMVGQSLTHEMLHVGHSGNLSANAGIMGQRKPFVIISRRHGYDANGYNDFYGYPSNKTVYLSNCSGFVRIKDIKLHCPCTDAEEGEILSLLSSGVYL